MVGGLDTGVYLGDFAFRINDKGVSRGEFAPFVIHHRTVLGRDLPVRVGEQFEVESFLRAKILVRLGRVHAHAENYRSGVFIFCQVALEIARLHGAAAGKIFRVKIEHDPFAAIILQAYLRTVTSR